MPTVQMDWEDYLEARRVHSMYQASIAPDIETLRKRLNKTDCKYLAYRSGIFQHEFQEGIDDIERIVDEVWEVQKTVVIMKNGKEITRIQPVE